MNIVVVNYKVFFVVLLVCFSSLFLNTARELKSNRERAVDREQVLQNFKHEHKNFMTSNLKHFGSMLYGEKEIKKENRNIINGSLYWL